MQEGKQQSLSLGKTRERAAFPIIIIIIIILIINNNNNFQNISIIIKADKSQEIRKKASTSLP